MSLKFPRRPKDESEDMINMLPQASGLKKKVKRIRMIPNTIFLATFMILEILSCLQQWQQEGCYSGRAREPGHFVLLTSPAHACTLRL